jgi:hypothetical protein
LCYAIGCFSRFQDKATDHHWNYLKRVLRYLKGSTDLKLVYCQNNNNDLEGYADSDYGNCPINRRSTSGFLFKLYGNTILWTSKKQLSVSTSTTEAEYISAALAAQEAMWLVKLSRDMQLNLNLPPVLYEDNNGCIAMCETMETKRSKHIDVKFHFLKELVWNRKLNMCYIPSKEQLADGLTKALPRDAFVKFVNGMSLKRGGVLNSN